MSPKFMQKCSKLYGFSLKTSAKQRFLFSLLLKRKCIYQGKLNVKTLSRPCTKRTHQRRHSKMCHLGMAAEQTHSVKLGISKTTNYNTQQQDIPSNMLLFSNGFLDSVNDFYQTVARSPITATIGEGFCTIHDTSGLSWTTSIFISSFAIRQASMI